MSSDVATNRKSLMLEGETYARLSVLAKRAGVPRPLIVQAILDDVDETKVVAMAKALRLTRLANSAELRGKQAALANLTAGLSAAELDRLLEQLRLAQPAASASASESEERDPKDQCSIDNEEA